MTDTDKHEIYELYIRCFPEYPIREKLFMELLRPEAVETICTREKGKLIGFSMLHGNSISLLCVDAAYRGKGVGSRLLQRSEEHIYGTGADRIILGNGERYLLQGVPDDEYSAVAFFAHRGYSAQWTSVNMDLPLAAFCVDSIDIPPCAKNVTFRFSEKEELPRLLEAVENAKAGWSTIFESCTDPVLIAECGGKILGFEILSPDGGWYTVDHARIGSVGCVGVIPEARKEGIGRQMVAHGVEWLKKQGSVSVELRYVALADWYSKLGFKVSRHQWMGEKMRKSI